MSAVSGTGATGAVTASAVGAASSAATSLPAAGDTVSPLGSAASPRRASFFFEAGAFAAFVAAVFCAGVRVPDDFAALLLAVLLVVALDVALRDDAALAAVVFAVFFFAAVLFAAALTSALCADAALAAAALAELVRAELFFASADLVCSAFTAAARFAEPSVFAAEFAERPTTVFTADVRVVGAFA